MTFKQRHRIDEKTGCWIWLGTIAPNGYGHKCINGKVTTAHRAYYIYFRGPVQAGSHIDHRCRNTRCVNPDHLEEVTPSENLRRGRQGKLSADDVATIRSRYAAGGTTYRKLAAEFGISNMHVSNIINLLKNRDVKLP